MRFLPLLVRSDVDCRRGLAGDRRWRDLNGLASSSEDDEGYGQKNHEPNDHGEEHDFAPVERRSRALILSHALGLPELLVRPMNIRRLSGAGDSAHAGR